MSRCRYPGHVGDPEWLTGALGRGQPRAFCPACEQIIARSLDHPPTGRCVVCHADISVLQRSAYTCSATCRSQLHRARRRSQ